ncbi:hypothetical protein HS125_13935 [bacterium]|nr:hypothetical protein [bacterium]
MKPVDGADQDVLDQLLAHLGRQREVYQRLVDEATVLRKEAGKSPEEADVTAILAAVEAREGSLAELARLDAALAPLRQRWNDVRDRFSAAERRPLGELVEELARLMQSVLALEDENCRLVEQHTAALGRELERVRRARRAGDAYKEQDRPGDPRFYDRKE